jgi:hypothetical protein
MSIEAMKQALEALSCIESPLYVSEINKVGAAMKALRQAIEEECVVSSDTSQEFVDETAKQRHEQEPDDLTAAYMSGFYDGKNKYAPQRQPLTDEQITKEVEAELTHYWNGEYIDTSGARDQLTAFARAIEAAHGIKGEV